MRDSRLILGVVGGALLWLAGCAQSARVQDVKPHSAELPNLAYVGGTHSQASIKVVGRDEEPIVPLSPDFGPIELTPEEQAAVGEGAPGYRGLKYDYAVRTPDELVGSWYGGPEIRAHGLGGAGTAREALISTRYKLGPWDGMSVGTGTLAIKAQANFRPEWRTRQTGPEDGATVGYDEPARKARAETTGKH